MSEGHRTPPLTGDSSNGRARRPDRAQREGDDAARKFPEAEALAVRGEKFLAVGTEAEVMRLAGNGTRLVDAGGRRVIPGLNDPHLHAIRGGLQYNLELR